MEILKEFEISNKLLPILSTFELETIQKRRLLQIYLSKHFTINGSVSVFEFYTDISNNLWKLEIFNSKMGIFIIVFEPLMIQKNTSTL